MSNSIAEIKRQTRIEDLIVESGYLLDRKPGERYWIGASDPNLRVDIDKQIYYWGEEYGDCIAWICARLGWEKKTAIRFLANRLKIPNELRPRLARSLVDQDKEIGVNMPQSEEKTRRKLPAIDLHDIPPRIQAAILRDADGFLAKLWKMPLIDFLKATSWIPTTFIPIVGQVDGFEVCNFCLSDLTAKWSESGEVYLSINSDASDDSMQLDYGAYCGECVKKFRTWLAGVELILKFKSENQHDP